MPIIPSVKGLSLKGGASGSSIPEILIPLWISDSGSVVTTKTTDELLMKNNSNVTAAINDSTKLHALSSGWAVNTKFALECLVWLNATATLTAALVDLTSGSIVYVPNGTLTTTSTARVKLRTAQLSLTPGNIYGVVLKTSNASNAANLGDAKLIAFPV